MFVTYPDVHKLSGCSRPSTYARAEMRTPQPTQPIKPGPGAAPSSAQASNPTRTGRRAKPGRRMRPQYRAKPGQAAHPDRLISYPDAHNLSRCSLPIQMFVTYPDERALRATTPARPQARPPQQHDSPRAEKKNRARQHTLSDPALASSQA